MSLDKPIPFSRPFIPPSADQYVLDVIHSRRVSGDLSFTKKCHKWFLDYTNGNPTLLTTSGTHALEMAALLLKIQIGDEVIMPSFTFSSTANAFILRGARIVFVDIEPTTMNIDPQLIEEAITDKTKAIVAVHYAGVSCDMDAIQAIANKHSLSVIEDAAQGLMSTYKEKPLGTLSDYGCYSFHETKNYTSGEGGALVINKKESSLPAEVIREKGTNRSEFFRGEVDKYTWLDVGSSFLPSDVNAALLYSQLEIAQQMNLDRLKIWNFYFNEIQNLKNHLSIELPVQPSYCKHNGHIFFLKVESLEIRQNLLSHLKKNSIGATFHYVPLHSSPAGQKYGRFSGKDVYTTKESERLLRLPIFNEIKTAEQEYIIQTLINFFKT